MTAPGLRWTLARMKLCDLLGFQGDCSFEFTPGLQVLEAPNHTGKTSLAMGLLWGLTGVIPKLDRLNLKSFRLRNKHSGENAATGVTITLVDGGGREMVIRRLYTGRSRDVEGSVELTLGDEVLTDTEADARILAELGLKPASLEGCGVVLQDHRLKLVTGKDSEISEVVNDMLGLEALSEVVPVLEDMAGESDGLRKEIDAYLKGGDPLQRWKEEDDRLAEAMRKRENDAIAAGFEPSALEDAAALVQSELAAVAQDLSAEAPATTANPQQEIERLRKRLGLLRSSSPRARELTEVSRQLPRFQELAKTAQKFEDKWREHNENMSLEAARGDLDAAALARAIADFDGNLARDESRGEEARSEQELLQVAYAHLLGHPETEACPLCHAKVSGTGLREEVKERLDVRLAAELEQIEEKQKEYKAKKKKTEKRLAEVNELATTHDRLLREASNLAETLRDLGIQTTLPLDRDALFSDEKARTALLEAIQGAEAEVGARTTDLTAKEAEISQAIEQLEEVSFQPLDRRLNRTRDALIPLLQAAEELEDHGTLRDGAEQRSGELERIQRESRDLAGRLKKIAAAVSQEESERATAAVQARLPFVSGFFARVAGNPDFTGLDVQTTVTRNKVAYTLRATSSTMAALGDVVGHVLSEGDMSAAGMALLLGLASGDSHRMGFLLLDDPAQGMDPVLQRNFAHELATLEDRPQVIILTHQPDFAAALAGEGAQKKSLGRWQGGRLLDA